MTNPVLDCVRRAALLGNSDGELLDFFITCREEAAFVELVRRHGPMVLGVCRRVLANPHDAGSAVQATFLVLVRKADPARARGQIGACLFVLAYLTPLTTPGASRR